MKTERDVQKRLIDIIAHEKDEKVAQTKLAAAVKEIRAAMSESERKALADNLGGLSEAAIDAFNNAWFRFFLTYDPRPTLRTVRCPVLAINGEKDLQVPAKENLAEIAKALKAGGNRNVKTVELPGLNHLFQPCKTGSTERIRLDRDDDRSEALKTIGDWIVERTGESETLANRPVQPARSDARLRFPPNAEVRASAESIAYSAPHLNRHLVDLGGQDEVVFGEAADGVGPQDDPDLAIAFEMEVGVMPFFFGERGDLVEEVDSGHEVLDRPRPRDLSARQRR